MSQCKSKTCFLTETVLLDKIQYYNQMSSCYRKGTNINAIQTCRRNLVYFWVSVSWITYFTYILQDTVTFFMCPHSWHTKASQVAFCLWINKTAVSILLSLKVFLFGKCMWLSVTLDFDKIHLSFIFNVKFFPLILVL